MGELDLDPFIHHFSHQHPLELSNLQQQQTPNSSVSCSGCKSGVLCGLIYTCKTCNYYLHISCSQMPQKISHPIDRNHMLTLFPSPVYPEGLFRCDACGRKGRGFCFNCKECQLDIHILCAAKPLSVAHRGHHHPLTLSFFSPYKKNAFSCDICKGLGSNQWLYRCVPCGFDAHLYCISENLQTNCIPSNSQTPPIAKIQIGSGISQQAVGSQLLNDQVSRHVSASGVVAPSIVQPARVNSLGSRITGKAVQGLVDELAQQAGQAMMQAVLGDSTSFGDSGLDITSSIDTILNN